MLIFTRNVGQGCGDGRAIATSSAAMLEAGPGREFFSTLVPVQKLGSGLG